jgi:hypothetical protein
VFHAFENIEVMKHFLFAVSSIRNEYFTRSKCWKMTGQNRYMTATGLDEAGMDCRVYFFTIPRLF